MPLNTFIFLDVIVQTSFLLSGAAFFFLALLFGDALLVRFEFKTFLKSLAFFLFGCSLIMNWLKFSDSIAIFWLMPIALCLLFIGYILDPLSRLRFILPLPAVFFPFLKGHILLFVLGLLTTLVIFQLAYTTKHRDLIPVGVGFSLLSIGEYFYHLETIDKLSQLAKAGSFLYLFSALVLLGWVWSYLAIRFINIRKKN